MVEWATRDATAIMIVAYILAGPNLPYCGLGTHFRNVLLSAK